MEKRRTPCCNKSQMKRGPWSDEESQRLRDYILKNGHKNWKTLPQLAGLMRCGKSCRLRWLNYLKPGIKRGNITKEDEDTIIHLHQVHGNKWSLIASLLPGRTDNEIKNVWNTHIKKRLRKMRKMRTNIDSSSASNVTEQPFSVPDSSSSTVSSVTNDVVNVEKHNQEVEFEETLMEDMTFGFQVDEPQSLEFLFQDHQVPPVPPMPKPESLGSHGQSDTPLRNQMVEPGLDDEWLNYLIT